MFLWPACTHQSWVSVWTRYGWLQRDTGTWIPAGCGRCMRGMGFRWALASFLSGGEGGRGLHICVFVAVHVNSPCAPRWALQCSKTILLLVPASHFQWIAAVSTLPPATVSLSSVLRVLTPPPCEHYCTSSIAKVTCSGKPWKRLGASRGGRRGCCLPGKAGERCKATAPGGWPFFRGKYGGDRQR